MALTNPSPEPIIVKIFKKGSDMPLKDLRGKTEVLDIVEIIEEDDVGTYIIEFTNTSRYMQDLTMIIKQIQTNSTSSNPQQNQADPDKTPLNISKEEKRVYANLLTASQDIKHFEVEQQMQINRINHFLKRKYHSIQFLIRIYDNIGQ